MFIDEVKIKVISWKWWDWIVSWRREKYIPKWWPRWWDWWKWWDVYIQTDENINTLSEYRHKKILKAKNWEKWGTNQMHWENAEDLVLKVPVWTIVKNAENNEILADLDKKGLKLLIAKWGKWWFWNAHFCSSVRQAPAFAELWDICEEKNLLLQLKLVADIGIIWLPSAWKSTFISKVTNVKPKIWDYPFTTLTPNLGVLDYKWKSLILEDVPWLIPWASNWKWLWITFLKHIERTWILLHLLDLGKLENIFQDYLDIKNELKLFSDKLWEKEEIIILSKSDLLDTEMKDFIFSEFKKKYKNKKIFMISSATREWIDKLMDYLIDNFSKENINTEEKNNLKVFDLKNKSDPKKYDIKYIWNLTFEAKWERIEQIIRMTDFDNKEAVLRVYDVLEKIGIIKKIEKDLEKIIQESNITNDFFFEWNDKDNVTPKIVIWKKVIELNKLKYNL